MGPEQVLDPLYVCYYYCKSYVIGLETLSSENIKMLIVSSSMDVGACKTPEDSQEFGKTHLRW